MEAGDISPVPAEKITDCYKLALRYERFERRTGVYLLIATND